jgi:diguanylate cyclase (GGDEF)-like protein/PAS domain S-box-containing protein
MNRDRGMSTGNPQPPSAENLEDLAGSPSIDGVILDNGASDEVVSLPLFVGSLAPVTPALASLMPPPPIPVTGPQPTDLAIRAEQWQQLCEIALDLSLSESYSAALSLLLGWICRTLNWSYGELWRPPTQIQSALSCAEVWYADRPEDWQEFRQLSERIPFAPAVGLPGRVWSTQRLEQLSAVQLQLEPLFPRASMLRGLEIDSAIGLPFRTGEHWLGVVVLLGRNALALGDPICDWLTYILDRLAPLLAQKQHRERQMSAELRYRNIFETLAEGVFQATLDGEYLSVNRRLAELYGYDSPEELLDRLRCCENYVHLPQRQAFIDRVRRSSQVESIEAQVYRKDGSVIWVSECAQALRDASGQLWGYIGTVEDVTDRKQVELELDRRDSFVQGLAEATHILLNEPELERAIPAVLAIVVDSLNVDHSYLYAAIEPVSGEQAFGEQAFGEQASARLTEPAPGTAQSVEELVEELTAPYPFPSPQPSPPPAALRLLFDRYREPLNPQPSPIDWQPWLDRLRDGQSIQLGPGFEDLPSAPLTAGTRYPLYSSNRQVIGVPIFIDQQFWGVIGCEIFDRASAWSSSSQSVLAAIAASLGGIFKRQQAELQIQHQAFHDSLTGLPNRLMFNHRLPQTLARARRTGETLAVMFLDLDRFKIINDSLGHAIGDQLLTQATARLLGCLRQEDILARWGGDEFTMCLPDLRSTDDVARVCQRLLESIRQPFTIDSHTFQISISIGIALFPQDGDDLASLLRSADSALYRVKESGRNHYRFYCLGLNEQSSRRLTLEQDLLTVLDTDQLQLYYQPQIDLGQPPIDPSIGLPGQWEALLRWNHPEFGLLLPAEFLPLAESLGVMRSIGAWVLRQSCLQLQLWRELGYEVRLGINLAVRQFQSADLIETLGQILIETGIPGRQLVLEVTESMLIKDIDGAIAILQSLVNLGVALALDDFGSGYSSLDDLKRLPISALKIDSRFVHGLPEEADRAIVVAIIALGRGLGLRVIAEGVETSAQLNCLLELGCTVMQGQLLYGPVTSVAATDLLAVGVGLP